MLIFGIIIIIVGIFLLAFSLAFFLGFTGLLHDYHYNNVKKEDKRKFTTLMGVAFLPGGVGQIVVGVLAIVMKDNAPNKILISIQIGALLLTAILSLIIIKKYNGKIFG